MLTVQDIEILKKAQRKLFHHKRLSPDERYVLDSLLDSLPASETLLNEKFPLDEHFEIKIFDIEEMWPQLNKWIELFNSLPIGTHVGFIGVEDDRDFWRRNVIIEGTFIPSIVYSRRKKDQNILIYLKIDGTATFGFSKVKDAENFPDLYAFNGSWKEAYLLVIKTLQQGWPQTKFPTEFEQLLKK